MLTEIQGSQSASHAFPKQFARRLWISADHIHARQGGSTSYDLRT